MTHIHTTCPQWNGFDFRVRFCFLHPARPCGRVHYLAVRGSFEDSFIRKDFPSCSLQFTLMMSHSTNVTNANINWIRYFQKWAKPFLARGNKLRNPYSILLFILCLICNAQSSYLMLETVLGTINIKLNNKILSNCP